MAVRGEYSDEEKKVLAEARELIGKTEWVGEEFRLGHYYPVLNRVASRDLIRRFVDVYIADDNPLWLSEDYARNTRWGCIIAPPFFLHLIAPGWGRSRELVIPRSVGRMLSVNAGSSFQFFKPVRVNDSFRVKDVVYNSIEDKTSTDGKGPRQFLISADRTYINQRDEVVAVATRRMGNTILPPGTEELKREDQPAWTGTWDLGLADWGYTEEEWEAIDRTLEEEERRGANPRYWGDVAVDDELKPVVHVPSTRHEQAIAYSLVGMNWSSRAVRRALLRQPEEIELTEDYFSIAITQTGKATFGMQKDCMLGHVITNWMGDDGFLKRFDSRNRAMIPTRDARWVRGKVIKKYVEDGEHVADLAVWIESIRGWISTTGTATVALPSRGIEVGSAGHQMEGRSKSAKLQVGDRVRVKDRPEWPGQYKLAGSEGDIVELWEPWGYVLIHIEKTRAAVDTGTTLCFRSEALEKI